MRRSDHPSRPSAITCSRFSALKTLAILAAGAKPTAHVNVSAPGAALAGFQVSINGRFWVSTEGRIYSGGVPTHVKVPWIRARAHEAPVQPDRGTSRAPEIPQGRAEPCEQPFAV